MGIAEVLPAGIQEIVCDLWRESTTYSVFLWGTEEGIVCKESNSQSASASQVAHAHYRGTGPLFKHTAFSRDMLT